MLSFECIKNEKSVYFLLTSAPTKSTSPNEKEPIRALFRK